MPRKIRPNSNSRTGFEGQRNTAYTTGKAAKSAAPMTTSQVSLPSRKARSSPSSPHDGLLRGWCRTTPPRPDRTHPGSRRPGSRKRARRPRTASGWMVHVTPRSAGGCRWPCGLIGECERTSGRRAREPLGLAGRPLPQQAVDVTQSQGNEDGIDRNIGEEREQRRARSERGRHRIVGPQQA